MIDIRKLIVIRCRNGQYALPFGIVQELAPIVQ